MRSEYLFFAYFIFMILEPNFDIGLLIALVFMGFIVLDIIWNQHNFFIKKLPKKRGQGVALNAYFFLIIVQILMAFITVPFNYTKYSYDAIKSFVSTTLLPLIVMIYFLPHINIRKFLELMRGFGLVVACFGFIETVTRHYILSTLGIGRENGFYSYAGTENFRTMFFFMHPGVAAIYMVMIFVLLLHMPFKKNIYQYIGHVFLAVSIYGTKTRMMWFAYIIIMLMFFMDRIRDIFKRCVIRKKTIYLTLTIGILSTIGVFIFRDAIESIIRKMFEYVHLLFDSNNVYVSRVIRYENIQNVIRYVIANPIKLLYGGGFGYSNLFSANNGVKLYYGDVWNSGIDNQYMEFLLEEGLWGVIPFLMCVMIAYIYYYRLKDEINKIGCMFIVLIGLGSISFCTMGWRLPVFILQIGLFIMIYVNRGAHEEA